MVEKKAVAKLLLEFRGTTFSTTQDVTNWLTKALKEVYQYGFTHHLEQVRNGSKPTPKKKRL